MLRSPSPSQWYPAYHDQANVLSLRTTHQPTISLTPISLTPTPTHLTPAPLPPTKTTNHTQGQHTPSINPINKNPHPHPHPPLAYASAKPFEFTSSHPNASGIMTTIPRGWVRRCRWAGWKLVGLVGGVVGV